MVRPKFLRPVTLLGSLVTMLMLELLDDLDLGHDAAENDDVLERAFVETQVYKELINDRVDLITGMKGTGKSALYRMITEHKLLIPQLADVRIIPAVNPTGSPVFKVLFDEEASESRLRVIWAAYLTALIGNAIVDEYLCEPSVRSRTEEIRDVLVLLGLRQPQQQKRSLLERILAAKSLEPSLSADSSGNVNFALRFDVPDPSAPGAAVNLEASDFYSVIRNCDDVLERVGERAWVVLDRLDECFTRDSASERRALRALLRTQIDIVSELGFNRRLAVKTFLRTDLLRRMTADAPFTNATHFRSRELVWGKREIQAIVGKRLLGSERFRSAWPQDAHGDRAFSLAWYHVLPRTFAGNKDRKAQDRSSDTLHLICSWTADGHRTYNPRNVLFLLRTALERVANSERIAANPRQLNNAEPLLREPDITSSLGKLSRKRLTDTVLSEFPATHEFINRLERKPAEYDTRDSLVGALGMDGATSAKQDEAISLLLLSGALGQNGAKYIVPRLYRPALKSPLPQSK